MSIHAKFTIALSNDPLYEDEEVVIVSLTYIPSGYTEPLVDNPITYANMTEFRDHFRSDLDSFRKNAHLIENTLLEATV